uniref:C2H2-type domain-containing protein n=1 Tax=Dicentrarchus labrax TaxID=13489 RepID=A0A8C4IPY7_DICLA
MANAPLQSFNVFLTERLTAAAMDIYGFVEKTIIEYQEEVYRTKLENQRLQRLLDLVYKPEIRLHRAGMSLSSPGTLPWARRRTLESAINEPASDNSSQHSRQIDFPTPTQKVCAQEQKIQKESIPSEADEESVILPVKEKLTEPWTRSVETPVGPEYSSHIKEHMRTHTGERPYSNLQNHMRVHTGERPYSCHFCGKCFKLKGHMTEHIRTHTGEKPFSCHICDKSFNRGSTLRKHVLAKHKEERPYKCEDCDELFTERLLMKRHMRKVHGIKLSTNQGPA